MPTAHNRFIHLLPPEAQAQLIDRCEPVSLVLAQVLCHAGEPLSHAYFPQAGWVSLVTRIDAHAGLEVGMVGREGMLGTELVLGASGSPWQTLAQGAGSCLRLEADAFRQLAVRLPALQRLCQRYLLVRLHQLSRAAACERFHQIGPRLARWLLMSHDRAHADAFFVTHEFMALMLGVRRVGVTMAAGSLQRQGLIAYHRGALTVLNRPGLEQAACSCYQTDEACYRHLMHDTPLPDTPSATTVPLHPPGAPLRPKKELP